MDEYLTPSVHSAIESAINDNGDPSRIEKVVFFDHLLPGNDGHKSYDIIKKLESCVWDFEHSKFVFNSDLFGENVSKTIKSALKTKNVNDTNVRIAVFKVRRENVIYHKKSRTFYYCDLAIIKLRENRESGFESVTDRDQETCPVNPDDDNAVDALNNLDDDANMLLQGCTVL